MALIDHIDGVNRRIYLSEETKNSSFHPIDLYKEMRTLRKNNENLQQYDVFMKAYGHVRKSATTFTERYVVLQDGTRVVPYDANGWLNVTGTLITEAGEEGIPAFDKTLLSNNVTVDIGYLPKQVEIIYVEVPVLTQEEHVQIVGLSGALDNVRDDVCDCSTNSANVIANKLDFIDSGLKQIISEVSDEVVENQTIMQETGFKIII